MRKSQRDRGFVYIVTVLVCAVVLLLFWGDRQLPTVSAQSAGLSCTNPVTGLDITIDDTSGGVTVLSASLVRCAALIYNNGTGDIRCGDANDIITSTAGIQLKAESTLTLGPIDGVTAGWKCIREGVTNSTVSVLQSFQ